MRGEQRPAGDAEIALASAATKARRTIRATAVISVHASAVRANRLAVRVGPAHLAEHRLGLGFRHAEHLSKGQGLGGGGKEEMLRHELVPECENNLPHTISL